MFSGDVCAIVIYVANFSFGITTRTLYCHVEDYSLVLDNSSRFGDVSNLFELKAVGVRF